MSLPLILLILLSLALCGVDAFHTNFVPSTRSFQSVLQGRQISKIMPIPKFCKVPRSTVFLNLKDGDGDETSRFESAKPFDKGASEFVPSDMQPANEWVLLKREFLFDWPLLPEQEFYKRLGGVFTFFFFVVSLPIASTTYDSQEEIVPRLLASIAGSTFVVAALVARLWSGYYYVSDRLLQPAVYFESDERRPRTTKDLERLGYKSEGMMWIKPAEVLQRDMLIRQYEVQPAAAKMGRLTTGLAAAAAAAAVGCAALSGDAGYDPRFISSEGRLQQLLEPKNEAAANQEAERLRAKGRPAYCYSRYYKALAVSDQSICD